LQDLGHALIGASLRQHVQTEADPIAVLEQCAIGVIRTVGQPRAELAGIAVLTAERARTSARATFLRSGRCSTRCAACRSNQRASPSFGSAVSSGERRSSVGQAAPPVAWW
jgi:hypothetical protein